MVPGNEPVAQGPLLTLAGVATDIVDGNSQRTAILSAPDNVLLVHEGDTVGGVFRVQTIEPEAVELVRLADGQSMWLRLSALP